MSTTVEESAVEEVMGRIAADMGGALGVLLNALGTRSGLWGAMAGAGPLTVDEVAAKVTVARPLVREWLASQAADGYLTYDPATRTFTLPDAVAAAVHYGPGGQVADAGATMFSSHGRGFRRVRPGIRIRAGLRLAPAHYHAAVDYHLGSLAVALGDISAGEAHFRAAVTMHERLGAAGWARLSARALADLEPCSGPPEANEFRQSGDVRLISYNRKSAQLPESKGLHDIAVLMGGGSDVHVRTLVGRDLARLGADPVLDDRAKAEFRTRLDDLEEQIDDAAAVGRTDRAEALRAERAALSANWLQLRGSAAEIGGWATRPSGPARPSARVRDAVVKVDRVHPELAAHLRDALQMGTVCCYRPGEPTSWQT